MYSVRKCEKRLHENLSDLQIIRGVICVNKYKEREEAELTERKRNRKRGVVSTPFLKCMELKR